MTAPYEPLLGLYAQTACIWEATARKPGNVHCYRDFADTSYVDFLLSAAAIAPVLAPAGRQRVGHTVLEGVHRTRQVVRPNTNLGILLLLAPLAAVPAGEDMRTGVVRVLEALDVEDARRVYEAIRLAAPAGLGRVAEQDIAEEPTLALREAMTLAADRDLVARQYANGFREVFEDGLPALQLGLEQAGCLEGGIIVCQLRLLAQHPDSLIARKRGRNEAEEAACRAQAVLDAGAVGSPPYRAALADLDSWLQAVGNGRNPGTTADLVAVCLFAALRGRTITLPSQYPWSVPHHD